MASHCPTGAKSEHQMLPEPLALVPEQANVPRRRRVPIVRQPRFPDFRCHVCQLYSAPGLLLLLVLIFFFFKFWPHSAVGRILVPGAGIEPLPLQWNHRVLTSRPQGKSTWTIIYLASVFKSVFKTFIHKLTAWMG